MSNHNEPTVESKDFTKNWVKSSRFVFYLSLCTIIAFLVGTSVRLKQDCYKGKPDVEVQSSTKFTPEYK
jgi:hypothetical protein